MDAERLADIENCSIMERRNIRLVVCIVSKWLLGQPMPVVRFVYVVGTVWCDGITHHKLFE